MEIPRHITKFAELYKAGKIKKDDVNVVDAEDPADATFEISIPTFDIYGDPMGTHNFALSVRTFIEEKQKLGDAATTAMQASDDFDSKSDELLTILQEIKDSKPKKVVDNEEIVIKL